MPDADSDSGDVGDRVVRTWLAVADADDHVIILPVARPKVRHPLFARVYARITPMMDRHGALEHRQRLVAGLTGTVVEIVAGAGANFARYPSTVERVVAGAGANFAQYPSTVERVVVVEPEPYLRALAERQAEVAPVPVDVVDGVAEELPIRAGSVNAAVDFRAPLR